MANNRNGLPISEIHFAPELQSPTRPDSAHARDIAQAVMDRKAGKIPRPELYEVEESPYGQNLLFCVDGHHTIEGYKLAGKSFINVVIYKGTWQDAIVAASKANRKHKAKKRSNEDKEWAVRTFLSVHPNWAYKKIGRELDLSDKFVKKIVDTVPEAAAVKVREGGDGKRHPSSKTAKNKAESNGEVRLFAPDFDPAAVQDYLQGGEKSEPEHVYADLLKAITSLAKRVSQEVNDAEPDSALRQYLLYCGLVLPRDKIVDGKKLGWQCTGLRGLYRVINLAGKAAKGGYKNKRQILAAFDAANRGDD